MPVRDAPLLEREAEVDELVAALEDARAGRGRLVVVEGPAGIGKTRLLAAARETAERTGMRVLRSRGSELESEFPFGLVRQLLEPVGWRWSRPSARSCWPARRDLPARWSTSRWKPRSRGAKRSAIPRSPPSTGCTG